MADIGLWHIAREQPQLTAIVDPDGAEVTYGELVAAADRYGRGLQQQGLRPGDCLVMMLPNSAELLALYFAAMQSGLYIVPINWHLVGAEVAYIVGDCDAKAFIAHERFADAAV
ncbi:MAG: long-chain acyl-CoA synthetase, partial [Pseudonocardiales bacterium]|nr:long-chain acyl-CoA synthetase [Pseudonocardiales bacterium]